MCAYVWTRSVDISYFKNRQNVKGKVVVIEEKKYWIGTLISLLDIMLSLSLV